MQIKKVKCPICGVEIEDDTYHACPYCNWMYIGYESALEPDELDSANPVTIRQAKENLAKGLDIWGDPLPKRKP